MSGLQNQAASEQNTKQNRLPESNANMLKEFFLASEPVSDKKTKQGKSAGKRQK